MEWKHVDYNYLDWMRSNYEKQIPNTNYGSGAFKPFFGSLFETTKCIYVAQVSSYKPHVHDKFKQSLKYTYPSLYNNIGIFYYKTVTKHPD